MPEKMRTRRTNLATAAWGRGRAAPESLGAWGAIPRRGLRSDAPRIRPSGGRIGPDRAHRRGCPPMPICAPFMHRRTDRRRSFVRRGTPAGSAVSVPASSHADGHRADDPPVRPVDYAALSAGWGAALATVLLASRDKGDEPGRPAETVPLGVL